ncbi:MAG: sulfotransferase domain-containing protein [SAR324 cluster bacterium]|nr:sulfotransferase domain-containing protein [SAR324 cluster bacterium]
MKKSSILLRGIINIQSEALKWMDLSSSLLEFVPRPQDIFIVTYPRSGTTLMQMMLYQLSTGGKIDFSHINEVVPFFDRLLTYQIQSVQDLDNLPNPRIFKSHLSYQNVPKGPCRYIYIERNGKDVAVSYFHFHVSHLGFQGTFDEFFDLFMKGRVMYGSWFRHIAEWQKHQDDPHVLYLKYEDLKKDLKTALYQIIDFCQLDVPQVHMPKIIRQCSFEFMKEHENKFDHISGMVWEKGYQKNAFIREGRIGSGTQLLTPAQIELFERTYSQI